MNQRLVEFCNSYKEEVKEITEKYSSEPNKMDEEIKKLESVVAGQIGKSKLTDEYKMEMINLFNTEDAKYSIVQGLKSDSYKMKLLEQFHDQWFIVKIIQTIEDNDLKLDALKYVTSDRDKVYIFVAIKDKEKILNFLENNPNFKKAIEQYLKQYMKSRPDKLWEFMKNVGLEKQIIPYLLFNSKYQIMNSKMMHADMREDIETYLGKPVPKNIDEMSMYERVGIDTEALQEEVITSKEQLGLDEFQKEYLSFTSEFGIPKKEEYRRKVPIRDFAGTFSLNSISDISNPKNWKELLYGLKRIESNIDHHSEEILFNPESNIHGEGLSLQCINGKYYINLNGNHRMTLLKAKYLTEVKMANGDSKRLAEIEEKYTIEASYVNELPSNPNELIGVNILHMVGELKEGKIQIKELTEDGKKTGYRITNGKNTAIIKSEQELQRYLQQEIEELKKVNNGQLFEKFNENVQALNLDDSKNKKYKKAFEIMTGMQLQKGKIQEEDFSINEKGEIIRENDANIKIPEEEQIEMTKPKEKSFKDEIDQYDIPKRRKSENRKTDVNLWMNRFKIYNGAIYKVSQSAKRKFVQLKSDIINEIKQNLKERSNNEIIQNIEPRGEKYI